MEIKINNLIFDFKKYQFNIKNKNNITIITFDKKAIGGFQHADIITGALYEVEHAVPGSLEHILTTYVNKIKITFEDKQIISEYKAINVL
ncbi:hypothetical protein QLL95_gp0386 [Cotonvirus japonicus]|uniref:Uncharacterized protein n=1 Tax=Cotonvirus japonicus TaxID=2811091 RepID=A0ABM7NUI6_9VIRU|nr:hypothetical protein QLL95_gp0386 [Cotonvirus japonicus]BCS83737.1 hypothetical protein [Cotonvirus japonicus]